MRSLSRCIRADDRRPWAVRVRSGNRRGRQSFHIPRRMGRIDHDVLEDMLDILCVWTQAWRMNPAFARRGAKARAVRRNGRAAKLATASNSNDPSLCFAIDRLTVDCWRNARLCSRSLFLP